MIIWEAANMDFVISIFEKSVVNQSVVEMLTTIGRRAGHRGKVQSVRTILTFPTFIEFSP